MCINKAGATEWAELKTEKQSIDAARDKTKKEEKSGEEKKETLQRKGQTDRPREEEQAKCNAEYIQSETASTNKTVEGRKAAKKARMMVAT